MTPEQPKNLKELHIVENLCSDLDTGVYLPVKKELEGIGRTYSLGSRKEIFKGIIEQRFGQVELLIRSRIQDLEETPIEAFPQHSEMDEEVIIRAVKLVREARISELERLLGEEE